ELIAGGALDVAQESLLLRQASPAVFHSDLAAVGERKGGDVEGVAEGVLGNPGVSIAVHAAAGISRYLLDLGDRRAEPAQRRRLHGLGDPALELGHHRTGERRRRIDRDRRDRAGCARIADRRRWDGRRLAPTQGFHYLGRGATRRLGRYIAQRRAADGAGAITRPARRIDPAPSLGRLGRGGLAGRAVRRRSSVFRRRRRRRAIGAAKIVRVGRSAGSTGHARRIERDGRLGLIRLTWTRLVLGEHARSRGRRLRRVRIVRPGDRPAWRSAAWNRRRRTQIVAIAERRALAQDRHLERKIGAAHAAA